MYILHLI